MITESTLHPGRLWRGRAGRRHRLRAGVPAARGTAFWSSASVPVAFDTARRSGAAWARFWDDRQAVRLKMLLMAACLLAAMWLEVPW
jgi:hypothetical protein